MAELMSDRRLAEIRSELARGSKYALEHGAMDIGCELLAEVDRLHARLAERGEVRPRATDTWAVAWDLPEGTRYSFPMENERYAREGFADLVRSGVTGIRLVVSRNGGKWRPVGESAG